MKRFFTLVPLILLLGIAVFAFGCSGGGDDVQQTSENTEDQTTTAAPNEDEVTTNSNVTEDDATTPPHEYPDKDQELNILFLGNSLIYYNDMPSMFNALAKAAGRKVNVESITKGSATMRDFATPTTEVGNKLRVLLQQKPNWDYIIIEPSRRMSPLESSVLNAEIEAAKTLQQIANDAGGKIILYSVWGNNTGSAGVYSASPSSPEYSKTTDSPISRKAHSKFMHEANLKVSEALGGVLVVEAGYAFENLYASGAGINLYHSDERHPSASGSYLVACTIFATLFGEKSEGITYTANISNAALLQKTADDTALNNVIPDLADDEATTPGGDADFNLLVIGSNLLDDYSMLDVLKSMVKDIDGKTMNYTLLRDSTFVINKLVDEKNDMRMRATLAEKEWDAIIVQLSRRCTVSGTAVAQSELDALRTIYPLLEAETDKIFLMTLNSKDNPEIFTTGSVGYNKTGKYETMSAEEGTNYYKTLVEDFESKLGCAPILYGNAYIEYYKNVATSKAQSGYLEACCLYNALFGKKIPETCTVLNGLSATVAANIRACAEKHCLKVDQ